MGLSNQLKIDFQDTLFLMLREKFDEVLVGDDLFYYEDIMKAAHAFFVYDLKISELERIFDLEREMIEAALICLAKASIKMRNLTTKNLTEDINDLGKISESYRFTEDYLLREENAEYRKILSGK